MEVELSSRAIQGVVDAFIVELNRRQNGKNDGDAKPAACGRKDAAEYCGFSTRTLDDLLTSGVIPRRKHGRKTLILFRDLDAYLASLVEVK